MPKTLGRTLWIFALLVFAVWSWHWLDNNDPAVVGEPESLDMAREQTDFYLESFNIVNVDSTRGQTYQLRGDSLAHSQVRGDSTIQTPRVTVFSEQTQDTWQGTAKVATVSADFSTLTLYGDVGMSRIGTSQPLSINTEVLIIDINNDEMQTDSTVVFTSEQWSVKANKMNANVASGLLNFDDQIEVHYELD